MKNRHGFLAALGVASGAALGLAMTAKMDAAPAADGASSTPAAPAKSAPAPTAAALAIAATYRSFDPQLSDAEIESIARSIDEYRTVSLLFNPRKKPLRNWDEMAVRFAADERSGA